MERPRWSSWLLQSLGSEAAGTRRMFRIPQPLLSQTSKADSRQFTFRPSRSSRCPAQRWRARAGEQPCPLVILQYCSALALPCPTGQAWGPRTQWDPAPSRNPLQPSNALPWTAGTASSLPREVDSPVHYDSRGSKPGLEASRGRSSLTASSLGLGSTEHPITVNSSISSSGGGSPTPSTTRLPLAFLSVADSVTKDEASQTSHKPTGLWLSRPFSHGACL